MLQTKFGEKITLSENRAVYEIMWKTKVEAGRPQKTIHT
jgi:hypothetical protein